MTTQATTNGDVNDNDDVTDVDDDLETEEWSPPSKEEWDRVVTEAKKANSEAATRKRLLRDLGYDKNGQKVDGSASAEENRSSQPASDAKAIEHGLAAKFEAIYSGLAGAGVPAGQLGRLARFIDTNSVVIDEDGVEGLTEQIDSLKADYPELFKRPRQKAPDANVVGAGKKTVTKSSESSSWQDEVRRRFNSGTL